MSEPRLSRGPNTSPLGTCNARVETALPDEIDEELTVIARLHGKTRAEWVRDLIIKTIRGEWEALRLKVGLPREKPESTR